ncbi:MAG: hypothetical protein PHC62_10375 [Candidatus Izemoplasmatales bacterium]|nr:hypothetical protein [Candidatus Izemoplasmatales bacterium]
MEDAQRRQTDELKNNSSIIPWFFLLIVSLLIIYFIIFSDIHRGIGFPVVTILFLTGVGSVAFYMLLIAESKKIQIRKELYGARELFDFYCASNILKLLILFVATLIYLESTISSNLILEMKESSTGSTAGLIIYFIVPFMILVNAVVLYIGGILFAIKIKKTFLAKILMPFAAVILTMMVMIVCDVMMPNGTLYIFAKALYLV